MRAVAFLFLLHCYITRSFLRYSPRDTMPTFDVHRFRESLSVEIVCNGQPHQIAEGTTVAELLVALKLSPRQVAVEVNLDLVPRGKHVEHALKSGDRVEVVTLVGGG